MKLLINDIDNSGPEKCDYLRKVFALASQNKWLGLDGIDGTVMVDFLSTKSFKTWLFSIRNGMDGATDSTINIGNKINVLVIDTLGEHDEHRGLGYVFAHELTHVRDILSGDLKDSPDGILTWKGEKFNIEDVEHDNRPWERVAIDTGLAIMEEFNREYRTAA